MNEEQFIPQEFMRIPQEELPKECKMKMYAFPFMCPEEQKEQVEYLAEVQGVSPLAIILSAIDMYYKVTRRNQD